MTMGYLLEAAMLGLSAALLPGALQAFFFAQAVRLGTRRALFLAFTPLLSDGPLVLVSLLLLSQVPAGWLRALRVLGGLYLLYLAWQVAKSPPQPTEEKAAGRIRTLMQAVTVNWLNPNPYIFWATVLGPRTLEGWKQHPLWGLGFIATFYLLLVAGNMGLLALFGRMHGLPLQWRHRFLRLAAVLLALLGVRFLLP